jgi:hypothetical protein
MCMEWQQEANARHIARCHPENIRALLDELDRLREVERRAKELQRIGGMLANAAYNLSQANLPSDQRKSLRDGQEAWDAAVLQFRLSTQVEERE